MNLLWAHIEDLHNGTQHRCQQESMNVKSTASLSTSNREGAHMSARVKFLLTKAFISGGSRTMDTSDPQYDL